MHSVYHGGAREWEKDFIDFSQSVNPYYPSFLKKYLIKAEIERYPYCEERYEETIKKVVGTEVALGAGVTELYYMAFYAVKDLEYIVYPEYTYSEIKRLAFLFNKRSKTINKLLPNLDDFPIIKNSAYFVVNPDNPTGKYYEFLEELSDELLKVNSMLIIDESFMPFTGKDKFLLKENVIGLRSFTKIFGIPGIRIGYAYGPKNIIEKMKEFKMPWSLGAFGCAALRGILSKEGEEFLKQTIPKVKKETRRISNYLGLKTDANFFFAKVENFQALLQKLRENKILVRDCTSFGLSGYIRFSVKKKNENNKLIKILKEFNPKPPF